MLCPRCYGKHVVLIRGSYLPCPECVGVGELNCCDGLLAQAECRYTPTDAEPEPVISSGVPVDFGTRFPVWYSL